MMKQRTLFLLLAAGLAASGSSAAQAHAFPDHSQPAVGSTLAQAPAAVKIWFTEKLEPAFSGLEVIDARGVEVDQGNPTVDPQDPTLLSVALKPLPPGTYQVVWHVVSVDTHSTHGDYRFTVQ